VCLPSRRFLGGHGLLAFAVALQHLLRDDPVDLVDNFVPAAAVGIVWCVSEPERLDDVCLDPLIVADYLELLHECFCFGHMFVPFGKPECTGSGQLALLATAKGGSRRVPSGVKAEHTAGPLAALPCERLDTRRVAATMQRAEQGKRVG
jgi:hypothetical protein